MMHFYIESLKFHRRPQTRIVLCRQRQRYNHGVYDIILPSSCMRRAYYWKKLEREAAEPKEPVMPYFIRGRAVEAAIARMLFGNAITMERHKRYEKQRIACYADLSDSKRIIEIKDKNRDRRLFPEDIQFKGYLMQVLYYMVIAEKETRCF